MELIQIIYSILFYGGTLLVIVIFISFLMSKSKENMEKSINIPKSVTSNNRDNQQKNIRKNETVSYPRIYQINETIPKEIKIIRKPTVTKREIQEQIRMEENQLRKTSGKRFTVVNDEMKNKKSKFNAANFYL